MVFLDMEKAFGQGIILLGGLKAVGFGPRFRQPIKLMYDVQHPPQRRIYANGYYSDWFGIKSGVAQGLRRDARYRPYSFSNKKKCLYRNPTLPVLCLPPPGTIRPSARSLPRDPSVLAPTTTTTTVSPHTRRPTRDSD